MYREYISIIIPDKVAWHVQNITGFLQLASAKTKQQCQCNNKGSLQNWGSEGAGTGDTTTIFTFYKKPFECQVHALIKIKGGQWFAPKQSRVRVMGYLQKTLRFPTRLRAKERPRATGAARAASTALIANFFTVKMLSPQTKWKLYNVCIQSTQRPLYLWVWLWIWRGACVFVVKLKVDISTTCRKLLQRNIEKQIQLTYTSKWSNSSSII